MIDIHSHILPMVDDGSRSVEDSLMMLINAYEDGTDEIVLTPHLAYEYGFENPYSYIKNLFEDFQNIVKQEHIPIQLYLGTEFLMSSPDVFLEHLEDITHMNQTQYILMEFFFDVDQKTILDAIDVVTANHLIPIIAHPERYETVQVSSHLPQDMINHGALLQMNKGSVFGGYGSMARDIALEMLEAHQYHFVGSDAHGLQRRTSLMYDAYCFVRDYYGRDYANQIFKENAKKMLKDVDIRKRGINE